MNEHAVPSEVVTFIDAVTREIIDPIIGIIFAAAFVYFLWGLAMFIFNAEDQSKRTQYKSHMLWGVIGMVVMVSVFSLLAIGLRTFGVSQSDLPNGIRLTL